ncbi:MAG: LPS export ABC transporter permease LptF [Bdellovibrio sp.]|nr:MAG: LPS export ABC transporter permease LptF [Bdellovibrio sp.]
MNWIKGRKATNYIFFEMWPSLFIGVFIFIFILLMAQALRLTEFVLVHGISVLTILEIVGYLSISFLPAILPMSLLFSVLLTYGRLSQDSEIVALKAVGYSQGSLTLPALLLSALVAFVSAQTSFQLAPWGNRQFEVLITKLGQTKAGASLKEGTFSEGFFDLIVYANKVNSKTGEIEKVFIYDQRSEEAPLTIISKTGQIIQDPQQLGHSILLLLKDGDIHRSGETHGESHTKVKFGTFEVRLTDPVHEESRAKSPQSFSLDEILEHLARPGLNEEEGRVLRIELHKRWAVSVACLIFGILGVALGTQPNRRSQKGGGFVMSLGVIILYWLLYITLEGMARANQMPAALALWLPNGFFMALALWRLRKMWN